VVLTIALFLIALVVVSQHRTSLVITVVAFTLAMISAIGRPHWRPARIVYADIAAQFCLVAVLSWVVGRALFAPGRVTYHRIQGAIAVYLQLALLFQFAYLLVVVQSPNAFSPAIVLTEANSASKLCTSACDSHHHWIRRPRQYTRSLEASPIWKQWSDNFFPRFSSLG
jgi:hypothetical protein